MKGISRKVVPYVIERLLGGAGGGAKVISAHMTGLDFFLDPATLDAGATERTRELLKDALAALDRGAEGRLEEVSTSPEDKR